MISASTLPGLHNRTLTSEQRFYATFAAQWQRRAVNRQVRDVGHYLEWFKKYFEHYCMFPFNPMHKEFSVSVIHPIAYASRGTNHKFCRQGPRGHAKSTHLALGLPLYLAAFELKKYMIIFADTSDQANKQLAAIKAELETNELLARDFPHLCGRGSTWNQSEILTNNHIRIEALGSGKPIRGKREKQHRPDLMIFTDLDSDDATFSAVERTHKMEWFQKSAMKAGGYNTDYVIEGTNLHNDSVVGHHGKGPPGWQANVWRAIQKWPTRMDLWAQWELIYGDMLDADREQKALEYYRANEAALNEGAKVLWPSFKPLLELMKIRAESHSAFESEYQNNPIDPSKCEWPSSYFEGDDLFFDQFPDSCSVRTIALDPSKGKEDKPGDYSAIIKCAVYDRKVYIDADLQHRDTTKISNDMVDAIRDFNPDIAAVESNAFQHLIINEILHEGAKAGEMLLKPPIGLENTVKKIVRIRKLSPWFNSRTVRFRRRSPGVTLLLKQLTEFPFSEHDDGPDALEMAIRVAHMTLMGRAA